MARMLNGDEDIDTNLIPQMAKDIIDEMDFMDVHVDIRKGLRFNKFGKSNIAEEEYLRAHNFVKKSKKSNDDEAKGTQIVGMQTFKWEDDFEDEKIEIKNDVLPYRTIEVIFNKKNIFVNKQHPNPASIKYDIYDKDKWFSVLKIKDPRIDDPNQIKIWKQDIPAFYSFQSFLPLYTDEEIDLMRKAIINTITTTIRIIRNQKNLNTTFKAVFIIFINIVQGY
jgi:hypothetical protein